MNVKQTCLTVAAFTILLAAPASASADAVSDWNAIAVQATMTTCPVPTCVPAIPARPGPTGALDIAMVQAAIYDAVQAIEKQFKPYHVVIPGATGSPAAAAAKAAHDVLVSRFPWQAASLGMIYDDYLDDHGLADDDPGVNVGMIAAAGIIALRVNDGSFPVPPPPDFLGGLGLGVWRPTPPANAPMLAPWLGSVKPFTIKNPSQFRPPPPPGLNSPEYTRDYNEVKAMGAADPNSSRTPDETDLAHFWNANYVVLLNRLLREIATAHVDNIGDSSRLFALADLAMADSLICAWDSKIAFVFWRPITAIRLGDADGNPRTAGDLTWTPLVVTPPYPDYTSGANNVTGAVTRSLALFFGTDHMTFDVMTTNTVPTIDDIRTYHRFSDVAEDVVNARIYEGIHFRFADTDARKQGKHVAQWSFGHFFKPLD